MRSAGRLQVEVGAQRGRPHHISSQRFEGPTRDDLRAVAGAVLESVVYHHGKCYTVMVWRRWMPCRRAWTSPRQPAAIPREVMRDVVDPHMAAIYLRCRRKSARQAQERW
jgi:hypothetical protein